MSIEVLSDRHEKKNLKRFNKIWTGCPDGNYGWLPVNPKFLGTKMRQNIQLHVDSDRKMAVEDVISLLKLLRNDLEVEVVTKSNRPVKRLSAGAVLLNEVAKAQPSRPDEELEELNEIGSLLGAVTRKSSFRELETA